MSNFWITNPNNHFTDNVAGGAQYMGNGFWFAVPHQVQAEAWPTEDYQLVDSKVETSIPETDLFAGLR